MLDRPAAASWIPAFAGMTAVDVAACRAARSSERSPRHQRDLSQSSFRGARRASPESITTTGGMDSGLALRAPRNDGGACDRVLAARSAPELYGSFSLLRRRAQGRPDAGWHPRPPCEQECTGQEPQVQPERPGLPCAMAYDLYALSSVHRACWPPSSTRCMGTSANLIPASGYQDHATSPSVPAALVSCSRPVHRTPPHVRDDAYVPRNEAG